MYNMKECLSHPQDIHTDSIVDKYDTEEFRRRNRMPNSIHVYLRVMNMCAICSVVLFTIYSTGIIVLLVLSFRKY